MNASGLFRLPLRKMLAAMFVVLALAPALALQPASAQPVEDLQYLCVSRITGEARAVNDPGDCSRYEMLIDLAEDAPVNACANRVTGVISIRDNCTRYEQQIVLGGEEPVDVCISRLTGQLRYSASGTCGRGETGGTAAGNFSADCLTSGDCPQTITEFYGLGTVTDTLTVSGTSGTITDVNLTVDLVTEDLWDVEIALDSPDGTRVTVFDNDCSGLQEELQVVFDDEGSTLDCSAVLGFNHYQPTQQALSAFDGMTADGEWDLVITMSTVGEDEGAGTVLNWSIEILTTGTGASATCVACMVTFPDASIGNEVGGTVSAMSVAAPEGASVSDLDVGIDITLGDINDLHIFVVSPVGTSVRLFEESCAQGTADLEVIFDDEAAGAFSCASRLGFNRFQPVGSLATFDGEVAAGTWHLVILSDRDGETGTLDNWSLNFELN